MFKIRSAQSNYNLMASRYPLNILYSAVFSWYMKYFRNNNIYYYDKYVIYYISVLKVKTTIRRGLNLTA